MSLRHLVEVLSTAVVSELTYSVSVWISRRLCESVNTLYGLHRSTAWRGTSMGKSRRVLKRFIKTLSTMLRCKLDKKAVHASAAQNSPTHCEMKEYMSETNTLATLQDERKDDNITCALQDQVLATALPIEVLGSDSDSGLCSDMGGEEMSWEEDWFISIGDISLEKVVTSSLEETVYAGNWHGSVTVHTRLSISQESHQSVMSEVSKLTHIRHENIQLFLGVCFDMHMDYIAIVMDQMKGESLHCLLHKQDHQFSFHSVTKIMSQTAQALEYLHAKGITHPLLSSKSILLHYRVCISMLSSAASGAMDADDMIYLPPEDIRSVHMRNGKMFRANSSCQDLSANVFSYGTLVYEMVMMERPFSGVAGNAIIWQVANGRTQSLHRLQEGKFKQVISRCWSEKPSRRPSFVELLDTIEQNMSPRACGLKSQFSFSEPSQLAKLGL